MDVISSYRILATWTFWEAESGGFGFSGDSTQDDALGFLRGIFGVARAGSGAWFSFYAYNQSNAQ